MSNKLIKALDAFIAAKPGKSWNQARAYAHLLDVRANLSESDTDNEPEPTCLDVNNGKPCEHYENIPMPGATTKIPVCWCGRCHEPEYGMVGCEHLVY